MKKIICLILSVLMLMALCVPAAAFNASKGSAGENAKFNFDRQTGKLIISPVDDSKEAKCEYDFSHADGIKTVVFENGITEIKDRTFCGCEDLEEVYIRTGTKYIGESVFEDCVNLKKVEFPKTLEKIGERAFYKCENIKLLVFRGDMPEIGDPCFKDLGRKSQIIIYTKNCWEYHFYSAYTENLHFFDISDYSGSTFSGGNVWIVAAVGAVVVIGIAAVVIAKKKKA